MISHKQHSEQMLQFRLLVVNHLGLSYKYAIKQRKSKGQTINYERRGSNELVSGSPNFMISFHTIQGVAVHRG